MEFKIEFPLVFTLLVLIINANVNATEPAAAGGAAPGAPDAGGGGIVFDITKLGAAPNGDATQGMLSAWKQACESTSPSEILIPPGDYILCPLKLEGPCKSNITMCVNGNFKAVGADKFTKDDDAWFKVKKVCGFTMRAGPGGGVFDGQGAAEWSKNDCKTNKDCKMLPYNMRFDFLNDSTICGITSKDSKAFHMSVMGSNRVHLNQVTIVAPEDSPNTDGIHICSSGCINITDTKVGTGDDCISMTDGVNNVNIERVTCGPGHGISIGSVGEYPNELPLTNITVKCCNLTKTQNGVRIKSWPDAFENHVTGVIFENINVDNVQNPIMIDQEYCPHDHCKSKAPSKVKICDVKLRNIKGTSSTAEVVTLDCSSALPCENVEIADIDLKYVGQKPGTAQFICKNVKPVTTGSIVPPACTSEGTPAPPSGEL